MVSAEADEQFFWLLKDQALNWLDEGVKGVSLKWNKSQIGMSYKISSQFFRIGKTSSGKAKKLGLKSARRRRQGDFHRTPWTNQAAISWYIRAAYIH